MIPSTFRLDLKQFIFEISLSNLENKVFLKVSFYGAPLDCNNSSYFLIKSKLKVEGREIELTLWDTAGQEAFEVIRPLAYKDAGKNNLQSN